ncbi:MAG: RNA 2',3'-cyclic phosphodiesterase [Anaerolineae bacterium]|jgi:2'-5' RNA ligase
MDMYRLFIAIPLPNSLLKRLGDVQHRLQAKVPYQSVRWVRAEGVHLTLKFLGDTPRDKIPAIQEALTVVARNAPSCELTAEGLGCFPSPRRPRVLWVGLQEPTGRLKALWKAVEEVMTAIGYKPERHGFSPHLTLGRVRRKTSREDQRQISEAITGTRADRLAVFTADRFELIRSVLKPTGAEYTTLATFRLRGDQDRKAQGGAA